MRITILTLFQEMFDAFLGNSIIKRAIAKKVVEVKVGGAPAVVFGVAFLIAFEGHGVGDAVINDVLVILQTLGLVCLIVDEKELGSFLVGQHIQRCVGLYGLDVFCGCRVSGLGTVVLSARAGHHEEGAQGGEKEFFHTICILKFMQASTDMSSPR